MHDYLFPIAVVRFAFILGVVVSMLMYERRHLTTGSLVVPGYVAVFLLMPSVIVATVLNAAISYLVVNKVLMRWVLLYGRSKFTVLAIVSISIQAIMLKVSPHGPWLWEADVPWFVGVGYVVPALIAHDMARQGIGKTAKAVLLASAIVAVPIVLGSVLRIPEVTELGPVASIGSTHLEAGWIPLAVLLSAAAAWGVSTNHRLRAGGFVGAALLGIFAVNPLQVGFILGVAVLTHLVVTRVLMRRLILFGRRKFASMLLLSSGFVWVAIALGQHLLPSTLHSQLGVTSVALTPLFLPGLIANDMQRASVGRVLVGVAVSASFVLTTAWTVQDVVAGAWQPTAATLVAAATGAAIFSRQLANVARALARRARGVAALAIARPLAWVDAQSRPPVGVELRTPPAAPVAQAAAGVPPGAADEPLAAPRTAWRVHRDEARERQQAVAAHTAMPGSDGYRPRHLAPGGRGRSDRRRSRAT